MWNYSLFTDEDIVNFKNGTLYNGFRKFGAHALTVLDTNGYYFAVWAPNASKVAVVGDFNGWKNSCIPCMYASINPVSGKVLFRIYRQERNTSFTSRDIKLWS
ncbi:MAG TPA: hypothetical protein PLK54_08800 [Ferruginibacter sp.]|nr:hypothetical protein [Ferruginibacter sp.]